MSITPNPLQETPLTPTVAAGEVLWCLDIAPILSNVLPPSLAHLRHTTEASLYITERILSYDDEDGLPGAWVPVHSKTLESVLGWRYSSQLLAGLVAGGVLERNDSYQNGEYSKCYRLTLAAARFPRTCLGASTWLTPKIRLQRHLRNLESIGASASAKAVYLDLARFSWDPDIEVALEELRQEKPLGDPHCRMVVHRLAHQQHYISVGSSGRLYHAIAAMPKKLRARLLADGQPTCELDVAGCQANCLVLLYEPGDQDERSRYIDAARVDPYQFLAGEIERMTGVRPTRNEVKLAWFREIFGHDRLRGQVYAAIKSAFPVLCERMAKVRESGYKKMSRRLQQIEASIMIDTVVPRIKARSGNIAIATVHDSIVCQRRVAGAVKQVMEEALAERLGYVPSIRST